MIKTRVTEILEIEHPIIQGGMLWLSKAELVAAVSNAGGLGILSAATFPKIEDLRSEIHRTKEMTDKPFGVNIPLIPSSKPLDVEGIIKILVDEKVTVLETAGRSPEKYMPMLQRYGIKVMHKVTAVRFAKKVEKIGCDLVIVDGFEWAGHPGEEDVSSMVLLPVVVDAVSIPVVAAGGFADGRGLVAAFALGAEGVLMGTRFMVSKEAPMHNKVKEYLISLSETDTMFVLRSLRNSARVIKNSVSAHVVEMESRGAGIEDLLPFVSGKKELELMESGNMESGLLHCGQVIGLIRDIPSVEIIINNMLTEASMITGQLSEIIKLHQ